MTSYIFIHASQARGMGLGRLSWNGNHVMTAYGMGPQLTLYIELAQKVA